MTHLKNRLQINSPTWRRLAGFWAWWIAELGGILPSSVRNAILPGVERLYLAPEGDEIIALESTSGSLQEIGRYPQLAAALLPEQAQTLQQLVGRARELVLCLPADKVLVKTLTLPLATEENLREVLGFEMDRQTPFSLDQVYYDHQLKKRNPKTNTLTLDLVVTPRPFLDDLVSSLHGLGIKLDRASLCQQPDGQTLQVNLLPETARRDRRDSARYLNLALGIVALLLLLATIALPLVNKLQVIDALESRTDLVTGKAEVTRRLLEQVEQLDRNSRFLVEKKQAMPMTLEIINELTRILPDDTWINRLSIKGQEVQIQGQSAAASALIPLIESSDKLRNPRFRSPVTRMPRTNSERFHLSAEVIRGQTDD